MQSRDFCYWLQGYFEIHGGDVVLTPAQVDMIKKHLNMVFVHEIDPAMGDKPHQDKLNSIHGQTLPNGLVARLLTEEREAKHMRMTADEIDRHEEQYRAAVSRWEKAVRAFDEAEKALARARSELTLADRDKAAEWRKLSQPWRS
jgi:hypothetical protein